MTCTYYGGSTAKFVNQLAHYGIAPNNAVMFCTCSPSYIVCLYHVGSAVAYDAPDFVIPYALSCDLDTSTDFACVWQSQVTKAINIEFLANCKLLDMPTYTKALQKLPSPEALVEAIRRAKDSLKPDFPRKRKTPTGLTDFIEELVHFDLKPINVTNTSVSFRMCSFELKAHIGRLSLKWEMYVDCIDGASRPFGKEAFQRGDRLDTLNLEYFEKQGFLDLARFNIFEATVSPPVAFQLAVREMVGCGLTDGGSIELPSGLLDDE